MFCKQGLTCWRLPGVGTSISSFASSGPMTASLNVQQKKADLVSVSRLLHIWRNVGVGVGVASLGQVSKSLKTFKAYIIRVK
jgi:hypothetical protein